MRDEYDLTDAVKHPLAGQFKGKFTAIVHYDLNDNDEHDDETITKTDLEVAEQKNTYSREN